MPHPTASILTLVVVGVSKSLRGKLEEGLRKNWKRLQKDFRALDVDRTGLLEMPNFLRALSQVVSLCERDAEREKL